MLFSHGFRKVTIKDILIKCIIVLVILEEKTEKETIICNVERKKQQEG